MRYVKTENTILAGELSPSSTAKIKLINMQSDELLTINSNVCTESTHIPGTYLWNTSNIDSSLFSNLTTPMNVLYMMYNVSDPTKTFKGKFVIGGELNNLSTITNLDTSIKNNNQLLTINQTELKTILSDADSGLPKLVVIGNSTLSAISNVGTKVDNNYVLTSQQLDTIKGLVSRRKITFASTSV